MAMKIGIRTGIAILGAILVSGTVLVSPSQSAENIVDPNQGWEIPQDNGILGSQNAFFGERSSDDRDYSALLDVSKLGQRSLDPTCLSLDDAKCSEAQEFIYYSQIPVCNSATQSNCIEAVSAIDPTGKILPGTFDRYFPKAAQNQYEGKDSVNLPAGGPGSIFKIPGAEGPAGNSYFVSFVMSGKISKSGNARLDSVHARVLPVQLQSHDFSNNWCFNESKICNNGWNRLKSGESTYIWNESGAGGTNCADYSMDENICAEKEAYPQNFRYSLKVRLSLPPTGWMHGRMFNPDISIEKVGTNTVLTVTANSISVPAVYKHFMWADMPNNLRELYDPNTGKYKNSNGEGWTKTINISSDYNLRAWTTAPSPYSPIAIAELNAWLPSVNNTSTFAPQFWSFRSLTKQELQGANKCFTDPTQLNGIVTTNSTAYSPGPPIFDKNAGDLNYQVAAPHYLANGTDTFKGSYDLLMRSEVARCIYGFSNAPIKASISIVSNDGAPQVATTVVSEKTGWLHLTAKNFEFSSPTVKVSLKQDEVVATPTPSASVPAPTVDKVVAVKTSIFCVKGKVLKKVTAVKPTCPSGYKKKQ